MKNFLTSQSAHAGVISDAPSISQILFNVLQFLLSVVAIVAIISIVIAGVRYLFMGNTNQSASIKKSLVAIVLGLVLVMGAVIIVSAVGKFLQ